MGHVFVLNVATGEPLFPVEERPVPASDVAGERQGVQFTEQSGTPYGMARYDVYYPDLVLPCHRGPWGTWVAVDLKQGRVLWEMSYRFKGRQHVVLTAGGSQPEGKVPGDFVLAYALPE